MPLLPSLPRKIAAFFGHPRGLSTLFFTEMWERFSYYGMRGFLILYMTAPVALGGMGMADAAAAAIYGTYTSMVYLMSLPGGWVADRLIGQRRAVLYGGILIASGHYALAIPALSTFYLGLVLVVLGTGLLKPNISVIVGQLYTEKDIRRDAGFSIFYMGINTGAFVGPLITGYLAQDVRFRGIIEGWGMDPNSSWHWGFGAAGVGMTLGLLQYAFGGRRLGTAGSEPSPPKSPAHAASIRQQAIFGLGGGVLLLVLLGIGMATGVLPITAEHVTRRLHATCSWPSSWGFSAGCFLPATGRRRSGSGCISSVSSSSQPHSSGRCSNRLDRRSICLQTAAQKT